MFGDRWGVTAEEVARRYPCDDVVPEPSLQAWRGVTVHAPRCEVWPWTVQIRLAPYSYDWVDNLGRRSPQELRDLPEPRPGEPFTSVGGRPTGRILSVVPQEHLTARIMGVVMSYVLVAPAEPDDGTTRLLLKIAGTPQRGLAPLLCVGDLVMARRQLLNLKRLAEQASSR